MPPSALDRRSLRRLRGGMRSSGLGGWTLHGLRHSFASLCLHLKIPEDVTKQLGGWADYVTVHKIYMHVSGKDLNTHTQELSGFFENANKNANKI